MVTEEQIQHAYDNEYDGSEKGELVRTILEQAERPKEVASEIRRHIRQSRDWAAHYKEVIDKQAQDLRNWKTNTERLGKQVVRQAEQLDFARKQWQQSDNARDRQAEQLKDKDEVLEIIARAKAPTGHLTGEDCQRIAEQALKGD